ncbi:TPA: RpiB/LacA/LacB family sugar-phosphate isomerase [Photobacterium damselae]|uniref:RpiB/LacA/LacB family sugar-phosphate isomerase n=1 Tax=Photobacterium damselae TaxID=38293 RepID=UPI002091B0F1|nr:RpiB/LacA/LacB family sugar-phosphate isomerase [Photobacterium damselae]USR75308.1 RpiB/LacA/LacB family sugar-phosphate isomerase [Photobacterium damselae]
MKIALTMENSQAAKNEIVLKELQYVAEQSGDQIFNVGMCDAEDHHLTYIHLGIQASILLAAKAVDFVFTGCGTGQGALMACNAHSNVVCGYALEPSDAFLFTQINNGNALSLAFAKNFGWAAELNVRGIFEKVMMSGCERGQGYPVERALPQQQNAAILNDLKCAVAKDYLESLKAMDAELVRTACSGDRFQKCLFENSQVDEISDFVRKILN